MNFISAIQHATIGYGIRRKAWVTDPKHRCLAEWLYMHAGSLLWTDNDDVYQLQAEDALATDWETI